jgi:hypothetical protein
MWGQRITKLRPGTDNWFREARRIEKGIVVEFVNSWLIMAGVRPALSQEEGGGAVLTLATTGLFGALAVQLLETAGRYTVASCTGCGKFFDATPEPDSKDPDVRKRLPKVGQGRYCRQCQEAKVHGLLAKRRKSLGLSKPQKRRKR